jgi:ankyrin repeat protein
MHLAAAGGHCDIAEVLLEAGGSPTSIDEAGATPYQLAVDCGHDALAKVSTVHSLLPAGLGAGVEHEKSPSLTLGGSSPCARPLRL